jgi:hypothetical protein
VASAGRAAREQNAGRNTLFYMLSTRMKNKNG